MQSLQYLLFAFVSQKGEISDYKKFFYGIVGLVDYIHAQNFKGKLCFLYGGSFFVVEDTILHTTQSLKTGSREAGDESLVTRDIVNEFWSMAQDEALAVLRSNCVSMTSNLSNFTMNATSITPLMQLIELLW